MHFQSLRTSVVLGVSALTLALSGCGAVKDAASGATDAAKSSGASASATSGSATPSSQRSRTTKPSASSGTNGDKPIGSEGFTMPPKSAKDYPPEQVSGPGAGDCYVGGSRIYDRSGITCADAKTVKAAYEATASAASGKTAKVKGYECSHNPDVMVHQGAAPAKCTDGEGNVVFDWRYPGAPQPEKS